MLTRLLLLALLHLSLSWGQAISSWTPQDAMTVDTIGEVVPSPDGSWVAFTRTQAVMEEEKSEMLTRIHLARHDGSRGFPLTAGEKSADSPAFSPDRRFVYFRSSRSGECESVAHSRRRRRGRAAHGLGRLHRRIPRFA